MEQAANAKIKAGNATIVNLRNIVESPILKFCLLRPSFGLGSHSSAIHCHQQETGANRTRTPDFF
jgi:hypothetical protein